MKTRQIPNKQKNPVKAIRENCIECVGGRGTGQNHSKLIAECAATNCPVYEFRLGKNPYLKKRTDKQLKSAKDNLRRPRKNPKPSEIPDIN